MSHIPMQAHTIRKYEAIQARYAELHETKRLRLDDTIQQIMADFHIATPKTVWRILGTDTADARERLEARTAAG